MASITVRALARSDKASAESGVRDARRGSRRALHSARRSAVRRSAARLERHDRQDAGCRRAVLRRFGCPSVPPLRTHDLVSAVRHLATAREQLVEHLLVEPPRAVGVGVGQRGAVRCGDAQVRESALTAREAAADLAERIRPAHLAALHGDDLAPTGDAARMPLGRCRHDGLVKFRSRNELEQLAEDASESRQGVALRVDAVNRETVRRILRGSQRPSSFSTR